MRRQFTLRACGTVSRTLAAAALGISLTSLDASDARAQPGAPLFASHEPLEARLAVPLRTLVRRKKQHPVVEGTFTYTSGIGPVVLDVEVTTRGFSRLELCTFPPLRLNFKRSQLPGTVLAGQNRIKLVTRCKNRPDYDQSLELEYLAYRILSTVSDYAYRVRKIQMRYFDTENGDVEESPAFLIEDIDAVAERLGTRELEVPSIGLEELDPRRQAELGIFQYLIGNTDWATTQAAAGEDCCHNMGVIAPRPSVHGVVTIPYDFDQSGFVNAPYAEPHPNLPIRSVRERLYRGLCLGGAHLEATIDSFNAGRAEIEELISSAALDDEHRHEALEFVAEGYETLNDPEQRRREITGACRG